MNSTRMRIVSAVATLALLTGTAGAASFATLASAATNPTTGAPTSVSASGATLNGTNGDTAAMGSSFWVSTSTFSTASSTVPSGVYSTPDLGSVAANGAFSAALSSAVGLPAITPSTTYYYAAWTDVGGVWMPGAVQSFSTSASTSPAISNVQQNVGTNSATISWNTDVPATGTVWYGTTANYGSNVQSTTTASTTQSVTLSNLSPNTLYHFAITAASATSTASTSDMTFTTASSTATTTPLAVTGVDAVKTTATADNTYTDGWEWVMHLTVPSNENAFHIKFTDWSNGNTTFPAGGNMEVYSAQSSNASTTGTAITNNSNAYGGWLYLTGDTDPNTPGRQIDLHILVKIPTNTPAGSYTTTYTAQSWPSTATSTAPTS